MRMMTGAILVLGHTVLLAVYRLGEPRKVWIEWYAYALGAVGIAMLGWRFVKDLQAELWLRKQHRQKGDT